MSPQALGAGRGDEKGSATPILLAIAFSLSRTSLVVGNRVSTKRKASNGTTPGMWGKV